MHIAICDDNVADRKQLERLLKRESDARALQSEGFYVDSYGNREALLRSPMLYDAFFIDMCEGSITGTDIVDALLKVGVKSPIVLCSSKICYQEYSFPANILFFEICVSESNVATLEFSFVVVLFFAICLLFIESVCNAGDLGSLPGLGRSLGGGNGNAF